MRTILLWPWRTRDAGRSPDAAAGVSIAGSAWPKRLRAGISDGNPGWRRCTGDFHVNMWGTSSSEEKLAGDPGNVIEATSIGGRWSEFFTAGKLAPGNFG